MEQQRPSAAVSKLINSLKKKKQQLLQPVNLGGLPSEELILDGETGRNLMTIFIQQELE